MVVVFSYCGVSIFISWCQHFHSWYQYFYLLVVAMLHLVVSTLSLIMAMFSSRGTDIIVPQDEPFFLPNVCPAFFYIFSPFFYIFSPFIYIFSPFISVCTIRSAVRPSQRSGRVVCFHSPCSSLSRLRRGRRNFLRRAHWFRCAMFRGVRHRC